MHKYLMYSVMMLFLTTPALFGQEDTEFIFSSDADRCEVLLQVASATETPMELSDSELKAFNYIIDLVQQGKPKKAYEKWFTFKTGLKERWFEPGVAKQFINYFLRKAYLETDKDLLLRVEEVVELDLSNTEDKAKYDKLYSNLIESMKIKNSQYELVSTLLNTWVKLVKDT